MVDDLEEFKKMIEEKGIDSVEEMQEETTKKVKSIPNIQEKYKKVANARGLIIEPATNLEIAFNEVLSKTGKDPEIDPVKKEFRLSSGIKTENELGGLTFKRKAMLVTELIQKILTEPNEVPDPEVLNKFKRFVAIRDIFAHVPVNWFADELEFNDSSPYKHFFKLDPEWKKLPVAFNEYMAIQEVILKLIPLYIKQVILKEKLTLSVLFGIKFDEEPKKDEKLSD